MGFAFSIERIQFTDDTDVNLGVDDILVVVGPNNAGKTSCLREIIGLARGDQGGVLVSEVTLRKGGSAEEFLDWLRANCRKRESASAHSTLEGWGTHFAETVAETAWRSPALRDPTGILLRLAKTEARLAAANAIENLAVGREPVTHPIHAVFERMEVEKTIAAGFKRAFGQPLFLDRAAGRVVGFRIGDPPQSAPWTQPWRDEVANSLHLQDQGDGMRSFVGCLLEVMATPHPVVLIDEPEAFLHSPQALQLGRMLALGKPPSRQLILATHSAELLRGLMNANTGTLRVIRVQRAENRASVSKLDADQVRALWVDPLLRVSNLLDGLFHEAVIVCEGDTDARLYAALLDAISDANPDQRRPDIMFVHTGGRDRIAMVVRALREVRVPVRAIADFDVLQKEPTVKVIFEALGGNWEDVRGDWRVIHEVMMTSAPPMTREQVLHRIKALVDAQAEPHLTETTAAEIRRAVKTVSAWTDAKRTGRAAIPDGCALIAYDRLVERFRQRGLFIVEVGELECLVPSVGGDGPRWVNNVITRDLAADPELATARSFIMAVVESLKPTTSAP